MIAHLDGTVLKILEKQVIVQVGGVGYQVNIGNDLQASLTEGASLQLFIHTRVKEDDLSLYGFADYHQLQFFQQLISVSGIGTKTALALLDMPLELTQRAIHEEDISYLSKAPGLGKKIASRLVLELKGKVEVSLDMSTSESGSAVPRSLQEEALAALESLGYDKPSIIRFMNTTDQSYETAEELVRGFLQSA